MARRSILHKLPINREIFLKRKQIVLQYIHILGSVLFPAKNSERGYPSPWKTCIYHYAFTTILLLRKPLLFLAKVIWFIFQTIWLKKIGLLLIRPHDFVPFAMVSDHVLSRPIEALQASHAWWECAQFSCNADGLVSRAKGIHREVWRGFSMPLRALRILNFSWKPQAVWSVN